MSRTRSPRRLGASLALTVALTGLAACSDDDEATTSTTDEVTTTVDSPTTVAAAALSAEACDAFAGLGAAMTGDPSAAGAAVDAFQEHVTGDLAAPAETVATAFTAAIEGGDPSGMESPEFVEANTLIGEAMYDGCEVDTQVDVAGVDYAFTGLPEEIPAGRVALRFTNGTEADEPHEIVLMRRADGADEPVEELLALPEEEAMAKLQMAGVAFADEAGSANVTFLDLEPGEYVAICMLPVGGGEEGEPHAFHGMTAELTVV
jgi:hypothetical protein